MPPRRHASDKKIEPIEFVSLRRGDKKVCIPPAVGRCQYLFEYSFGTLAG
jgi:hypothetical protein